MPAVVANLPQANGPDLNGSSVGLPDSEPSAAFPTQHSHEMPEAQHGSEARGALEIMEHEEERSEPPESKVLCTWRNFCGLLCGMFLCVCLGSVLYLVYILSQDQRSFNSGQKLLKMSCAMFGSILLVTVFFNSQLRRFIRFLYERHGLPGLQGQDTGFNSTSSDLSEDPVHPSRAMIELAAAHSSQSHSMV